MTLKDRLKQLFTEIAGEAGNQPAEQPVPGTEHKQYSLKDGSKVIADKLEKGGTLMTVDANGTAKPADAGEYTLADGTVLTVADGGKITDVKAPDAANADAAGKKDEGALRDELEKTRKAASNATQKLAAQEQAIAAGEMKLQAFGATLAKQQAQLKDLAGIVQEMLEMPADEALHQKLSDAEGGRKGAIADRRSKLMDRIEASKG